VWDLAADAFSRFSAGVGAKDVLVFMPGGYEIRRTIDSIRQTKASKDYLLLPLHGELTPRDQDAAVARYDQPKVVVATNVAETSITIDGVGLVIDSGLARIPRYDPNRGINTLLVEKISRASADQRAGRAGRTAPGHCMRLWSQAEHDERPAQELPEIKRLDLSEMVLTLKAAGVEDLRKFRWLESPGEAALSHAEELLLDLGALSSSGPFPSIAPLGHRMLAFPVHPRYARMLIAAEEYGCVYDACLVAALTQGRDLVLRSTDPNVKSSRENLFDDIVDDGTSDFDILIRAWNFAESNQFRIEALRQHGIHAVTARQVGPLLEQFLRIARDTGLDIQRSKNNDALRKCILIGFSDRVARRVDEGTLRCALVHGRRGTLAKESVARNSELLVAAEVREIGGRQGDVNTILSLATAIPIEWLKELFPHDMQSAVQVEFDSATRRVQAKTVTRFRDLNVSEKRIEPPPADAAASLLTEELVSGRLQLPSWDHSVAQWIVRLNLLVQWCPELLLPPIQADDRRHILEQFCHGSASYKDLKDLDVRSAVKSWLSSEQSALLNKHAPERITLSNGRTPKVTYDAATPPFISLRIQELFGVMQTPKIGMGRVPVSVHILAPSMRPVQVTQDLANFWKDHYPKIKSELKRRYPKHEWR
jgi:ATP-dependent helicase HrpB